MAKFDFDRDVEIKLGKETIITMPSGYFWLFLVFLVCFVCGAYLFSIANKPTWGEVLARIYDGESNSEIRVHKIEDWEEDDFMKKCRYISSFNPKKVIALYEFFYYESGKVSLVSFAKMFESKPYRIGIYKELREKVRLHTLPISLRAFELAMEKDNMSKVWKKVRNRYRIFNDIIPTIMFCILSLGGVIFLLSIFIPVLNEIEGLTTLGILLIVLSFILFAICDLSYGDVISRYDSIFEHKR